MLNKFEQYEHYGEKVWVRSDLKGTHRDHCLCHKCVQFKPNQSCNCPVAQKNYEMCVEHGITTPVYECPQFILAKHIYFICPVRGCDSETMAAMTHYVEGLEKEGHFVHFPPRDVDQMGDEDLICRAHVDAMASADEVHAWWDGESKGSHFDFGMAYMLNWFRPIKFVLANNPDNTPKKSFTNYYKRLAAEDDSRREV